MEAEREIRRAVKEGEPFLCYFAHYAPHTPIEADERFAPAYRENGLDDIEAAYASLIEGMDKSVGDLLNLLEELQVADNTLVVFTSDNGGLSHSRRSMAPPHTHNRPLSSGKGSHHEGGIRVPLLVRWPGHIPKGVTSENPVMIYDWFPTLLEIAKVEAPKEVDGKSLTTLLLGGQREETDRPLVWHFPNFWGPLQRSEPVSGPGMGPSSTLRRGDYKLIYYHTHRNFELFDLEKDLGEQQNLAEQKPELLKKMALELTRYLEECNAVMPIEKATGQEVPWPIDALE